MLGYDNSHGHHHRHYAGRQKEFFFITYEQADQPLSNRSANASPEKGIHMKLKIHTNGFEGYAKRAAARARKLDRRESVRPEITITFDNPLAMAEVLTPERLRLLQQVRTRVRLDHGPGGLPGTGSQICPPGRAEARACRGSAHARTDQSRTWSCEGRRARGPRIPAHCGSLIWAGYFLAGSYCRVVRDAISGFASCACTSSSARCNRPQSDWNSAISSR